MRRIVCSLGAATLALVVTLDCRAGTPQDAPLLQATRKYVTTHQSEAIALLEKVVNLNSGTLNLAGVREVGDVFRREFDALGFQTEWVDGTAFARAGHLVARHPGKGPHILLIAHLDTVFEPTSPFQKFERVSETRANGPGTCDMKGGLVVALYALRALRAAGELKSLNITVVAHGDEESAGAPIELARKTLIDIAKTASIAIGLENAADDPKTAVIARRSSNAWRVTTTGVSSHSSRIFQDNVGAGAINELARILNAFYTDMRGQPYLTFNPALMLGGSQLKFDSEHVAGEASSKNNIVADRAVASGDLRTISNGQYLQTKERMTAIVARHLPNTGAEIAFFESYPPMPPTDGNRQLLSLYAQASQDLGYGPVTAVDPLKAGAADISFVAEHVRMAIDGVGLLGGGAHTVGEFADLKTFPIQTERLALLLSRLQKTGSN